jgi:hypothetical protein
MLTTGLVQFLLAQAPITELVGNAIQPIPATEPYPCITYQMVSDVPQLKSTAGVSDARIVFDCLAVNSRGGYLVARNIALAVKAAFIAVALETAFTSSFVLSDGTRIFFCEVVNVTDNFDNDALLSRSSVHVLVTYSD